MVYVQSITLRNFNFADQTNSDSSAKGWDQFERKIKVLGQSKQRGKHACKKEKRSPATKDVLPHDIQREGNPCNTKS